MGEELPQAPTSPGSHHGLPVQIPFLELIKRRNVGRVAILYVVLGYLVLEVFGYFMDPLRNEPRFQVVLGQLKLPE